MANFPGFLAPGAASLTSDNGRTDSLLNWDEKWRQNETYGVQADATGGPYTFNLPISQQENNEPAHLIPAFKDDYYNRVHVIPRRIGVGNLVAPRTFEVEVWNAWIEQQKTLQSIDEAATTGITYQGPPSPPTVFERLESRLYDYTVTVDGPAQINATFTYDFAGGEAPDLQFIGTRLVTWAFEPNWRRPIMERMEWLTDVMESYSGKEQRIELREFPRRTFEMLLTVQDRDKRRMQAMMTGWQDKEFLLPIWTDRSNLTQLANPNDLTVLCDTTLMPNLEVGQYVTITEGPNRNESSQVASFNASSITLENPIGKQWQPDTKIFPASVAVMQPTARPAHFTGESAEVIVSFALKDQLTILEADSAKSYLGYRVLEDVPNWVEDVTTEYKRTRQTLDTLTGAPVHDDRTGRPELIQSHRWTLDGRSAIEALRQWFQARRGRLVPVWVPTFQHDIKVAVPIVGASADVEIENIGFSSFMFDRPGRRDLQFVLWDGTIKYRRVLVAEEIDDDREILTLDATFGTDTDPADIARVSFLALSRLDADAQEFAWAWSDLVETRALLRMLDDDV